MLYINAYYLIAVLFTAFASPLSSFYFYPIHSIIQNLYNAHTICPNNSTNVEKYHEIVKDARKCYEDSFQGNDSICHSFEIKVQTCSQPLVDNFVDCLPEKSKDLPPALLKAATSVVDTFCTSSGEILLEVMNTCLYEFIEQRNKTIKEECKKEILGPKLEKFGKEVPSKSEVCQVVREIGDCWEEYVNQDCKSSKAKELFSKFYNAALSPCKNNDKLVKL